MNREEEDLRDSRDYHLRRLQRELVRHRLRDPAEAVAEARRIEPVTGLMVEDVNSLLAGTLIDAGGDLKDSALVVEGISLLRQLIVDHPAAMVLKYNLANGLSLLAQLAAVPRPQWYLETSAFRREARRLFEEVSGSDLNPDLRARALTNQANLLWSAFRWVEAYEGYREAFRLDPTNPIASSGAARLLLYVRDMRLGPPAALESLAKQYIDAAKHTSLDPAEYPESLKNMIDKLPATQDLRTWDPDLTDADDYMKFVAEERLALSLTIEAFSPHLGRWDSLIISSVTEDLPPSDATPASGVPPVFAAFNQLKADYLAARWIAFEAINNQAPETGQYGDTLDYAVYGVRISQLLLAQRAAVDLLDRVAVAVSEYLRLPGVSASVRFTQRWHRFHKGKPLRPLQWQAEIGAEALAGNPGLIALADLGEDIAVGGALETHRSSRGISTHSFVVLHDLGVSPSRQSRFITHEDLNDFTELTLRSLRIARASVFYLAAMIAVREGRRSKDMITLPLSVPLHHHIRGEDG